MRRSSLALPAWAFLLLLAPGARAEDEWAVLRLPDGACAARGPDLARRITDIGRDTSGLDRWYIYPCGNLDDPTRATREALDWLLSVTATAGGTENQATAVTEANVEDRCRAARGKIADHSPVLMPAMQEAATGSLAIAGTPSCFISTRLEGRPWRQLYLFGATGGAPSGLFNSLEPRAADEADAVYASLVAGSLALTRRSRASDARGPGWVAINLTETTRRAQEASSWAYWPAMLAFAALGIAPGWWHGKRSKQRRDTPPA